MKLQNKKTGGVIEIDVEGSQLKFRRLDDKTKTISFGSLAELNEEWEDYEEPKEYWAIDCFSPDGELVSQFGKCSERIIENRKQIGNYFETKEEAEKAVEKLKAWQRLKGNGFRFTGYSRYDWNGNESPAIAFEYPDFGKLFDDKQVIADLDLLFSREDD